jgi:hypothetical protein
MAGITTQRLLVRSPLTGFQNIQNTSINNNRLTDKQTDMNTFSNMIDWTSYSMSELCDTSHMQTDLNVLGSSGL